jgi:hypothetical protein
VPSPIPRQEFGDPLGWMVRQAREHVGEPSLWIDRTVALCERWIAKSRPNVRARK